MGENDLPQILKFIDVHNIRQKMSLMKQTISQMLMGLSGNIST